MTDTNLTKSSIGHNVTAVKFVAVTFPDEVKALPVPSWLESWEDAEFAAPEGNFDTPLGDDIADVKLRAAYWLMSMTGGNWLSSNDHGLVKRSVDSNLDGTALSYLQTGDQELLRASLADDGLIARDPKPTQSLVNVEKRRWVNFFKQKWHRSRENMAWVGALEYLEEALRGGCEWLDLGRSAVCTESMGNIACVSWTGGWHDFPKCVAANMLASAKNEFGFRSGLSAYCLGCIEYITKRDLGEEVQDFRRNYLSKRGYDKKSCVSNRPTHC